MINPNIQVRRVVVPLLAFAALLVAWQLAVDFGLIANYLLPAPVQVIQALIADIQLLASHTATTLIEALIGLSLGVLLGFVFAVLMDRFETLCLVFDPLMTISQTVPTIAIAPLLVLWFGYGLVPKVLLVVIGTFFPITVSLVSGFRSVDTDQLSLMRVMRASNWQIFWYVKLPAAAEHLFSGLKISATYAIVGAVISEWLGGSSGLGVYMTRVRKSFSYDRMFASILVISALSLALMKIVDVIQRLCMPWKRTRT